jgi:DNA modification methylase
MSGKKKNRPQTRRGPRQSGPPQPVAIRSSGDDALRSVLEKAIAASGQVARSTHGFHTYPAGMHPDTAAAVIGACPGPVHDPFCGGGTVLVEAMLAGRDSSGTDVSPIALLVSQARVAGPELASPLRSASRKLAAAAQLRVDVEVPEACVEWYQPHVAQELGRLRDGIRDYDESVQPLLRAVLSSILVKVSFRQSDTVNQRVTHHRPPGTTAILFHKKAREIARKIDESPAEGIVRLAMADARDQEPPEDTALVLTSPPYPGVYDYVPMQQLRLAWLDIDALDGKKAEIGSRRSFRSKGRMDALKRWREDTSEWISTQAGGLISGGAMAIVVGDGLVGDKPVDTLSPTIESMRAAGLEIQARASADRPDHARQTIRTEHIVLARKG